MTTNDIDAIRNLADAATEGPWQAVNDPSDDGGYPELSVGVATGDETFVFEDMDTLRADAEFIAAARTLVPALCDEIEQLRAETVAHQAEIARLREELNTLGNIAYRGANPGGALDALAEIHHRAGHAVSGWASVSDTEDVSR